MDNYLKYYGTDTLITNGDRVKLVSNGPTSTKLYEVLSRVLWNKSLYTVVPAGGGVSRNVVWNNMIPVTTAFPALLPKETKEVEQTKKAPTMPSDIRFNAEKVKTAMDAIHAGFSWGSSRKGFSFWQEVSNELAAMIRAEALEAHARLEKIEALKKEAKKYGLTLVEKAK